MPEATHEFRVAISVERVWEFVSSLSNWAQYVPGFHRMEEHDPDYSTWWVRGQLGPIVKTLELDARVREREAPERIRFTLEAVGDPIRGEGTFRTHPAEDGGSLIHLCLKLEARPPAGPIVNMIIGARLTKDLEHLAGKLTGAVQGVR